MTVQQDGRAAALRGLCGGAVCLPGDPAYDMARTPWNLMLDDHPAAVAYPGDPAEVAEVVRTAAACGLSVAAQGTGHGAPPLAGRLADAVLLRTSAMTSVRIDPVARTARAGAGVLWGDLAEAAGRPGLAALHPTSPDVGVVGFSIGGGLGWYSRELGLACNAVTAAEIVLADGTLVRATAESEPDLFWAVRGGGTPLGVVCALELALHPIETVVAGTLVWDLNAAERVLPAWVEWCASAPRSVTSSFRLLSAPDDPALPALMRGRRLVVVDGAVLGADGAAAEVLAPLRALAPEVDTFARVPASSLVRLHLEPEGPTPAYASSTLLGPLDDRAVGAVLDAVGPGSGSELSLVELRQLGGALAEPDPTGGVLDHLDGDFLALGLGLDPDPAQWPAQRVAAGRFIDAVSPWASGRTYLPMLDDSIDTRKAFPPAAHARLAAIRARVDPARLFTPPHR